MASEKLPNLHVGVGKLRQKYTRAKGPVAFLDESYQAPRDSHQGQKTFYVFTAVVVNTSAMEELRNGLTQIASRQTKDGRIYWHTTEAMRDGRITDIRHMLEFLSDGDEPCVVAHSVEVEVDDRDAEHARRQCYHGLATALASPSAEWDAVRLLVLEERHELNLMHTDDINHRALIKENRIPRHVELAQTTPGCEPLLWLPDLVGYSYRRTITHSDESSELFNIVKDQVHFVPPRRL